MHRIVFDGRIMHECNFSKSSLRNAGFVGTDLLTRSCKALC
ncbi:hypothetical protein [Achromobacter seleniivolatilans]